MSPPTYVIAASVPAGNRVRGFFTDSGASPSLLLERPPQFRYAGFDTTTMDQARLVDETAYEVKSADRKLLRLYQDGTLIFRMAADADFLGWGQEEDEFARFPRLNPVSVVEAHASFVYLYRTVLPTLVKPSETVEFTLTLRGAQVGEQRLALTQYYKGGIRNIYHPPLYRAHSREVDEIVDVATEVVVNEPEHVAYQLVERFYSMFDMAPDLIPFVKEAGGVKSIDIEQIRQL